MKIIQLLALVTVVSAFTASAGVPDYYDDFDTLPYTVGQSLDSFYNQWQSSGGTTFITNSGAYEGVGKAAVMGSASTLTNTVNANASLKVWTDLELNPVLGVEPAGVPTNTSSLCYYFDAHGVLELATAAGWRACTNDVWGNAVPPATNGYVRLSVFQDYAISTQAVFLNGRLILQDQGFTGTAGSLGKLMVMNTDSNCWLDNVWIKTNYDAVNLTNNYNGDGVSDAWEVNTYGYARRTLYVYQATTNLVPLFDSLTNALASWRPRDLIHVVAGNYAGESVVIAANPSNVVFEGDAFTVSNLTVVSGGNATFAQSVSCGTLALTGQVAMAGGMSLTSTTAHVVGSLAVSGSGALVVTNLDVGAAGLINFSSAQLVAIAAGVTMNGTFAISNTWGAASVQSQPLPFSDNFDSYGDNTAMTALKTWGWNASSNTVKVQSSTAYSVRAVEIPAGTLVSNSMSSAATKVWSDFYIEPVWGCEPTAPPTNTASFVAYVNASGYLVVAVAGGGWVVCSNGLDNAAAPLSSNAFTRVSLCQDLGATPPTFAVFVAGSLVGQGLLPPSNPGRFTSLKIDNVDATAYWDNVLVTTSIPPGLTKDLNHNGMNDSAEIDGYGLTSERFPGGTIYKIR